MTAYKSLTLDLVEQSFDSFTGTSIGWGCHFRLNLGLKISYLASELHELKIFEIRFGEKVHAVNTYYVNIRWKFAILKQMGNVDTPAKKYKF